LSDAHWRTKRAKPSAAAARRQALDDNKRSFLRMVSHELRTPLNSIIGFSEIISSELYGPVSDPKYRDHAELIRDSGHKLLRLVNQIMEIARLDAGAADLDIRPEVARTAVDEVFHALSTEAEQRDVELRLEVAAGTPPIMADARGLKTILVNLIQNALTFSPAATEIVVAVRPRGREVEIAIRDHGPGIEPVDVPRLMRPFEQGEAALTRRGEGAGLGLPIVQLLCQAMNGHLRLAAAPGGGLIASIRLPMAQGSDLDAA
jgi:signal transduction histidine kinase